MQLVCPLIQNKKSAEQFIAYQNQKSLGKNKQQWQIQTVVVSPLMEIGSNWSHLVLSIME